MEIIRERVRTRGHALDRFEGLGFKAYLVRDTTYAPFCVWNTSAGMANFLYRGGGFQAILADFGRPVVAEVEVENKPGLHSAAVGVDPRTWEVVRFELWEEHPGEEGVYEVLHLSEPELGEITAG